MTPAAFPFLLAARNGKWRRFLCRVQVDPRLLDVVPVVAIDQEPGRVEVIAGPDVWGRIGRWKVPEFLAAALAAANETRGESVNGL